MHKIYLLLLPVVLITACTKEIEQQQSTPLSSIQKPYCGAEIASRSIPAEYLQALASQRIASAREQLTILLDFDGEIIRPGFSAPSGQSASILLFGGPRFAPVPNLTAEEKTEIQRLVEDDFAPFNIVITTDRSVYEATPANSRMICVFTTTASFLSMDPFTTGIAPDVSIPLTNQAAFVFCTIIQQFFPDPIRNLASVASHELGHLFSLEHQHQFDNSCIFQNDYHPGIGTGPLGFAPIMGDGVKRVTTWWLQQSCQFQDDFTIINNFVELKPDDFPDSPGDWTEVEGNFTGTLGHPGDVDFIFIRPLSPDAISVTADNIDLKVSWCAPGGAVIATFNDPEDIDLTIPRVAGLGFLKIEAASNANLQSQFMMGKYNVTYLNK